MSILLTDRQHAWVQVFVVVCFFSFPFRSRAKRRCRAALRAGAIRRADQARWVKSWGGPANR
jgi:hypothetical protein